MFDWRREFFPDLRIPQKSDDYSDETDHERKVSNYIAYLIEKYKHWVQVNWDEVQ